jgi:hypothetical protein
MVKGGHEVLVVKDIIMRQAGSEGKGYMGLFGEYLENTEARNNEFVIL